MVASNEEPGARVATCRCARPRRQRLHDRGSPGSAAVPRCVPYQATAVGGGNTDRCLRHGLRSINVCGSHAHVQVAVLGPVRREPAVHGEETQGDGGHQRGYGLATRLRLVTQRALTLLLHHLRVTAPFPPSHYCLKLDEMERLGFPSPSDAGVVCVGAGGAGGEAETAGADGAASGDGAQEHLLGIDCEMVLTSEGRELARVTVVDQALETVYDTLVVRTALPGWLDPMGLKALTHAPIAACWRAATSQPRARLLDRVQWHHGRHAGGCHHDA